MTGKELIHKAFRHETTPRTPWVPYTGVQIGQFRNYTAEELLKSDDKLVECLMESNRQYTPDGQPVVFDLQIEAEVLGCGLLWAEKSPPTVSSHPLKDTRDIPSKIPGPGEGRIPLVLSAMRRMHKAVGGTTSLYGLACGPFTLASHLRSTDIFLDMYDDEEYVKELLSYCADVFIAMADYYIDAGMDIIGAVDPLVSQISPDSFKQFLAAPYKRVFDHIRKRGVFSSFFVCGDATKNIEEMCKTGPDCLSIDENIDMVRAKKITDRYNLVISGNLQLTVVMLLGNQKDNQKAAVDMIDAIGGKNFILAPGCDMPFDVPIENVVGVGQAVHNVEATRKFLANYHKEVVDVHVDMPDYPNLDHVLIEVLTIDSATCAACGYMKEAADAMTPIFGEKVEIIERKITQAENIARLGKLGISNLPTITLNGKVKYVSLIPNKNELKAAVEEVLAGLG